MRQIIIYFILSVSLCYVQSLSHTDAFRRLKGAGITVSSSGGCSSRHKPSCTSLDTIRDSTIAGIIALKQASGCVIRVTGGTETGHSTRQKTYSHWNGYKVDIAFNSCIDRFIMSRFMKGSVRSDGAQMYKSLSGDIYAKEKHHWDILYY